MYAFLRFFAPALALIGWIFYQLLIKRKPWSALKGDAIIASCFTIGVILIYYYLAN
jgi:hypothetical protein